MGNSLLHVGNWVSEHPKEECSWGNDERQTKARQTPGLEELNRSESSSEGDSGPSIQLVHHWESEPQNTGQIPPLLLTMREHTHSQFQGGNNESNVHDFFPMPKKTNDYFTE